MKKKCLISVKQHVIFLSVVFVFVSLSVSAQKSKKDFSKEEAVINQLIDDYNQTEDDCDFEAQAEIMSADRIFVGAAGEGRAVDQSQNMKFQKIHLDIVKKEVPGIIWHTESRDRIIKFYGDGDIAIASFFWFRAVYVPAGTPPEIAVKYPHPAPHNVTLVFEKKNGEWKIVHTHMSLMYPVAGH